MEKREIKFRAWVENKSMINNQELIMYGYSPLNHIAINRIPSIFMQFTGLLDKNGKEIYEGDIIMLNCGSDDGATVRHKINAVIKWSVNRWFAEIPDKKVIVNGGSMEGKEMSWREIHSWNGMHDCLSNTWVKMEIIGNIYETPELLKEAPNA